MAKDELQRPVEQHDGIAVIRGGGGKRQWNGIHYKTGMSSKNVGAHELSINLAKRCWNCNWLIPAR